MTRRPTRRPTPPRAAAARARSARGRLAAWVAVLTAATVLPVGLATVVAPPAAAATTSTTFALPPSGAAHIALTPDGTAYASNAGADSIARVTDAGVVTDVVSTVADMPLGIVADADGTVYSAQYGDSTISRIAPDGTATAAWVTLPWNIHPYDLAIDPDGNLYTANPPRRTVSKIAPDGTPTPAWVSEPSQPIAVAADPTGGGILTANSDGSLSHFAPNGARTVIRGPQVSYAVGIAYAPDGTAYAVDPDRTVTRISSGGVVTPGWATVSGSPAGLAVDGLGNVYVSHDDAIAKIDPSGTVTAAWATLPTGSLPGWLAANADGSRVWVASLSTGAVIRVAEFFPPAAVRALAVTGGDRALELAFDAPTSDGGSVVTGYQVSTDGGTSWASLTTTVAAGRLTSTVSTASDGGALVNGTSYGVVVRAVNAAGPGAESAAESATPATVPGTVGALAVTGGDRALELVFDAPASTGGSVVTGYQVSTDGGVSWAAFAPTTDHDGRLAARLTTTSDGEPLVNGTSYGVVVRAVNAAGKGAVSATVTAAPVAPPAPPVTAPGPPTGVTVIPGDRQARVSWNPPADDGGAPITGYTVEATPEGTGGGAGVSVVPAGGRLPKAMAITKARVGAVAPPGGRLQLAADTSTAVGTGERSCTTTETSCTVTGLTNGVGYRFTVTATNSAGTSAATVVEPVVPTEPAAPAAPPAPTTEAPVPTEAPAPTGAPAPTTESPGPPAPATTEAPATTAPAAPTPPAGTTAPGPAERIADGLAYTGFEAIPALVFGVVLVVGGVLALTVGRRRPPARGRRRSGP